MMAQISMTRMAIDIVKDFSGDENRGKTQYQVLSGENTLGLYPSLISCDRL